MKRSLALAFCVALTFNQLPSLLARTPGGARASAQTSSDEARRVERLVALCKLWGAVKYFHPYLADRDIDWDAALVAALPKIDAARTTEEFAAAVESLTAVLEDPATRVLRPAATTQQSASANGDGNATANGNTTVNGNATGNGNATANGDAAANVKTPAPLYRTTADGLLVVNLNDYGLLSDFAGLRAKLPELAKELPKARAVIFDLRPAAPPTEDQRGGLSYFFQLSQLLNHFIQAPVSTPGERTRMHMGFPPQRGGTSGGYTSAFLTTDGSLLQPTPDAKEVPVVFLVNKNTELPSSALALQAAGKARIVSEGESTDAAAVSTQRIELTEGVSVEMRLGELVYEDGTTGLQPDKVVAVSAETGEKNPAWQAAVELLKDFHEQTPKPHAKTLLARSVARPDKPYAEMAYPAREYRVLAAFRIWNVIHYFFPYKDLIGEDWDAVLREFIPRMERVKDKLEYTLMVAEMVTHFHDSHGFVESAELYGHICPAWPPVRARIVEGVPVITAISNEEAAKPSGVQVGDVVLKVDGKPVADRIALVAKYLSASTPQAQRRDTARYALCGPKDTPAVLTVRDRAGQVKELTLPRQSKSWNPSAKERDGEVLKMLAGNIGYADLDRLTVAQVDEMFEKFKDTRAIIFDMRGYPNGTAWSIAPRLTERSDVAGALFQRETVMGPGGAIGELLSQSTIYSFMQTIPRTDKWRYKGRTVMLIDERTQSQAEHTGLFFEAANGTRFVGSPTAGANGDVTNFYVPGGIVVHFSGQAVRHADGRQLQRKGLVPDVPATPTIKGLQSGRDEVLEAAIKYLERELAGKHEK
jgi:C-terminal processing protease CtpA/Prc